VEGVANVAKHRLHRSHTAAVEMSPSVSVESFASAGARYFSGCGVVPCRSSSLAVLGILGFSYTGSPTRTSNSTSNTP
jgi:hypothetical protein